MMGSGRDVNDNFIDILEMIDGSDSKYLSFIIDHSMALFREQLNEAEEKCEIDENGKLILKKKR